MRLPCLAFLLQLLLVPSFVLAFGPLSALFGPAAAKTPDMSCSNMAQKIVALADNRAVFDFCGGMMFQLVLSDKLRSDLLGASEVVVHDSSKKRMHSIPSYERSSSADDVSVFYGREVRKVPDAAGGMGFVLQLVSSRDDPEGWSEQEISEYNGWAHDSGRKWRKAGDHASEGNTAYGSRFGQSAFGLHHRFYWHLDERNGLWLSAEDGCEGVIRTW